MGGKEKSLFYGIGAGKAIKTAWQRGLSD